MGFWQALDAGLTARIEEKTRKEERQQEIDLRTAEREEERKYRREEIMLQAAENRKDALLAMGIKKEQEKAEAAALAGKAQSLIDRFGDSKDPRVAALASDVRTAAELEDKIYTLEVEAQKAGVELPPLQGEALLELLTVYDPRTKTVAPVDITLDDILAGDYSDVSAYYKTAAALSQPAPRVDVKINPEAYRRYDPEVLEEGRKVFDQEVLRLANDALDAAAGDANEEAKIRPLIEGYAKEGSGERFALMDMFGPQAFAVLAESGNPYIQDLENDATLSRYSTVYQLNRVIADPEATEEEKAKAQELLTRLQ
jgi:hypothetical protein